MKAQGQVDRPVGRGRQEVVGPQSGWSIYAAGRMPHIVFPQRAHAGRWGQTELQLAAGGCTEQAWPGAALLPHTSTGGGLPLEQLLNSEVGRQGHQADLGLEFLVSGLGGRGMKTEGRAGLQVGVWPQGPRSWGVRKASSGPCTAWGRPPCRCSLLALAVGGWHGFLQGAWCQPIPARPALSRGVQLSSTQASGLLLECHGDPSPLPRRAVARA